MIMDTDSVELAKKLKEQRPDASCLGLYLRNVEAPELDFKQWFRWLSQ